MTLNVRIDEHDRLVVTQPCGLCGRDEARGMAAINDTAFCHDNPNPATQSCYEQAQTIVARRKIGLDGAVPIDEWIADWLRSDSGDNHRG